MSVDFNQQGIEKAKKGNWEGAVGSFNKSIDRGRQVAEAYANLGTGYEKLGDLDRALGFFQQAKKMNESLAQIDYFLGIVWGKLGDSRKAIGSYKSELKRNPLHEGAWNNLGNLYFARDRWEEALGCYEKVLGINPNSSNALVSLVWLLRWRCDWKRLENLEKKLDLLMARELKGEVGLSVQPLMVLSRRDDVDLNMKLGMGWSEAKIGDDESATKQGLSNLQPIRRKKRKKIRVGYLSADFREHVVGELVERLFELHDRSRFEVVAYSAKRNKESRVQRSVEKFADRFVDISRVGDREAAGFVARDGVDVVLDLGGHTRGNRLGVLAYKPARVQMSWLGFPGTTGANFVDYLIVDPVVVPPDMAKYYVEKLVYLPGSYLVGSCGSVEKGGVIIERKLDMKTDGVVLGCFCSSHKYTPEIFGVWMEILRQVEGSVLWIGKVDEKTKKNLRNEAKERGVDKNRLVFAEYLSKEKHLERIKACDLMLDTFPYNGHVTTLLALCAGVPVVSMLGEQMASRVASSLLVNLGLSELVVRSKQEYVRRVVEVCKNEKTSKRLKRKLEANKERYPLFEVSGFVTDLERAYELVWKRYVDGKAAATVRV